MEAQVTADPDSLFSAKDVAESMRISTVAARRYYAGLESQGCLLPKRPHPGPLKKGEGAQ